MHGMAATTSKGTGGKISAALAAAIIVVVAIIAGAGWGLYLTKKTTTTAVTSPVNATVETEIVTSLAFEHWNAIGMENVNLTMAQYSPNATLYWYVKNTTYDHAYNAALNGTHSGLAAIRQVWTTYFTDTVVYYWVEALRVNVTGSTATVTSKLWYIMANGTVNQSAPVKDQLFTAIMPYELYYVYSGGHWMLTSEWWGFPNNQGTIQPGAYGLKTYFATF